MDLRTGRTFGSVDEARAAGVPESDIAEVHQREGADPDVRIVKSGPFKGRVYRRNRLGQMERVRERTR